MLLLLTAFLISVFAVNCFCSLISRSLRASRSLNRSRYVPSSSLTRDALIALLRASRSLLRLRNTVRFHTYIALATCLAQPFSRSLRASRSLARSRYVPRVVLIALLCASRSLNRSRYVPRSSLTRDALIALATCLARALLA